MEIVYNVNIKVLTKIHKGGVSMSQDIYLSNYELNEAMNIFFSKLNLENIEKEKINTCDCLGRVTTCAVFAKISSPHYNASAMDGIAANSRSTNGASEKNHIELIENYNYIVVDTGDPIPKEFDAVIMVEDLIKTGNGRVAIYKSAAAWQNIRPIGEDIVAEQLIVPSGHKIRPVDIGAIIAGGVNKLEVYRIPIVGIIATGTEIVEADEERELKVGDIIDFNSPTFAAQVTEWGGKPKRYGIVKDVYDDIKDIISLAICECDIVLINAGSSAGREDFTDSIIRELGEVYVHGIAIKPGKPGILGSINKKPIIGIPGYPVSAYFIMDNVVKKLITSYQGMDYKEAKVVKAILSRKIMSSLKHLEFVRIKLGYVEDKLIATPLSRGAGATLSLVRADGILEIPQNVEGIEAGTEVGIKLMKEENDIKNTIVCIGSHDPMVDIVGDIIHRKDKGIFLSSANVGSMGGIMALKNGETHLAPIHLLDMDSGDYNVSYIKKYIKGKEMAIIKGVGRIQGFLVNKGNPKNIKGFEDLTREDIKYVNRQRGAGTRLLLDYNLSKFGICTSSIYGYEREEFTHLSVAAVIAAGDAHTGLGVYSAATIMGLDFVPVCTETYDFAIPSKYLELEMIQKFIEALKSNEFKFKLKELGGYEYGNIGEVIVI